MKQKTFRILNSCGLAVAICGIGIYNTVHRGSSNSIDYQLKINYQAHPLASIIGSMIPGIIAGFAFYWWGSWRASRKQKKLSSINPKEAASLHDSNIDDQHADLLNAFLKKASASDIQEFILNINGQSGYVQRARTALDIRIAENSEINDRRTVHLTWAILVVSVALLAFPFLQMIIGKNHEVVKAVANTSTDTRTVGNSLPNPATHQTQAPSYLQLYRAANSKDSRDDISILAQAELDGKLGAYPAEQTRLDKWAKAMSDPSSTTSEFYRQKKLAESGDAAAQLNLSECYITGKGVQFDLVEGLKWRRKAAEQGNADAQFMLGLDYENDTGVTHDYVQAWKWFKLAETHGKPEAFTWRVSCAASMTPEQITEAQKLSTEFRPHTESASTNSN